MPSITEKNNSRILSIDILRGLVMVIMALDHTRDFFHAYSFRFDATDLGHTSPAIFFTRWITHFCAPVFIFLSGTSACLSGQRKSKKELSSFLWKRGLWIILLEVTVNCLAWTFSPDFTNQNLQVLWAIGISMITLSLLIRLPFKAILITGLSLIFLHNLLDSVHVAGNTAIEFIWSVLHEFRIFTFGAFSVCVVYPVIPWIGLMATGYCFGRLYTSDVSYGRRRKFLITTGLAGIALFILLRSLNIYGDPLPRTPQDSIMFDLLSFLNTLKYPPSLLYLLMTISPSLIALAFLENGMIPFSGIFITFGRVPLFYYLIHVFVIHAAAMIAAMATGFSYKSMILGNSWISEQEALKGYGFNLPMVYLAWLTIIIILYFPCRWYDKYKSSHSNGWLRYI